jgi:hypothetical protein
MSKVPVYLRGNSILRRLPSGNVFVAEIGCFVGTLSRYLLSTRANLHLIMVDSWAATEDQPETYRVTGDRHAHQTEAECRHFRLSAKAKVHRYGTRARVLVMPSVDGAKHVDDGSLDLVFIDGDHSEFGVAADILAWQPKIKHGGWIGGHDYGMHMDGADFSGVERAVNRWAGGYRAIELDDDHTWFCRIDA